jgi:quinoprotein dehydrogenase-associated probable ABC transporter substrate-binding protein
MTPVKAGLQQLLRVLALALLLGTAALAQSWEMRVCAEPHNLPFSNDALEGFENRIALILAEELDAQAVFVWIDPPLARIRDHLIQTGECDVLMAISDGHPGYLNTVAYYRSIYSFFYLADSGLDIDSFDDERLADLRIGVQVPDGGGISPVTQALGARGLIPCQVTFVADLSREDPLLELPQAVLDGEIDLAVVWGPIAGYAAMQSAEEVIVKPVSPEIEMPFLPMFFSITVGVRPGDEALRDELNVAIANRWEEIQQVLEDYGVPRLDLPVPVAVLP